MNILVKILFPQKTEYYSIVWQEDSAKIQYDPRIESASLSWPGCQLGVHEVKKATLILDDRDGTVTGHLESGNTNGVEVGIYNGLDETLIASLFLTDFDTSVSGKATIIASDKFQELDTNVDVMAGYVINDTNLETTPPVLNIGKYFNFFSGNFTAYSASKPGKNGLRCYRAETLGTGSRYIIGKAGAIAAGYMPAAPDYLVNPSGSPVVITGWTISQASDGYWYLQKAGFADIDYIDVNFTLTTNMLTKQLFQDVGSEFFNNFQFVIGGALDLFSYDKFHIDPDPLDVPAGGEWRYNKIAFSEKITGVQILERLCGPSTGINYYIQPDRKVFFTAIDINNISHQGFQQWESSGFKPAGGDSQSRQSVNEIAVTFGKNPDGSTEQNKIFKNWESRADIGYWLPRNTENIIVAGNDRAVTVPAGDHPASLSVGKRTAYISESPSKNITYEVDLDQGLSAAPFDLWKFNHVFLNRPEKLYEIIRIEHDFMEHVSRIEFKDRSYIDQIDKAQVFRLQGNFPGSQYIFFEDISPGGEIYYTSRFFTGTGQEVWTDADKKYTSGSVFWNGTNWSKTFGTQNLNAAWQIWDNTKWCFFAWVKFPTLGATEIMIRSQDPADSTNQNYFDIRKGAGDQLRLLVVEGGVTKISFSTPGGAMASPTTWYHVGMVKNGTDYGWYVDGVQVAYLSSAYAPTGTPFAQPIWFAQDLTSFYKYKYPEWVLWVDAKGPFLVELSPDAGLTSSYITPTGAVTNIKGKFVDYSAIS